MVAALIDHIEVYHAEKQDGITNQCVDMFAIETHPFISDVSMAFTRFFVRFWSFHAFSHYTFYSQKLQKSLEIIRFQDFSLVGV